MNNTEPRVITVGYSPNIKGGLTFVTGVLVKNFPLMELHSYKNCYYPKRKAVLFYFLSVFRFFLKIIKTSRDTSVLMIIGSSGDAVKSMPYILLSKLRGLKICAQYHKSADHIFANIPSHILTKIVKAFLCRIDIHCFLSAGLKCGFNEVFPNNFRSFIIHNPLERKWIETPVLTKSERYRDIVFFGRWSWEKGIDDLLQSMSNVKSNIKCEIYTDNVPSEVHKNCEIHNWVNESEVMCIMKTAKLLILPSYSEAYPMVLLEAAACGTPFLASNIAGIPDIAEESGGGRVFNVGEVPMMTKCIDEMLSDDVKWREMSENGKTWVKTLDEDIIRKQWLEVFYMLNSDVKT